MILLEKAKVGIVAFAFGVPHTIRSNRRIAEIASQKALGLRCPVYTQFDIEIESGIETTHISDSVGGPPPTLQIAREAVRWAKSMDFSELWIVAAKPHLWRCKRDLLRAIRESGEQIMIRIAEEIDLSSEDEWYCSDSTQERTRSRKNWRRRERIIEIMPFFIYKLVAG